MSEEFFVTHSDGRVQKGVFWPTENAKANLVISTGMQEHAQRYDDFATYLNGFGYNVYCLDQLGQGLNAVSTSDLQKWPKDGFSGCVNGIALALEKAKGNGLKTYVFGHSMGSFMIQALLERYPGIAEKYVICGSNGPKPALYTIGAMVSRRIANERNWDQPSPFLSKLAMGGYPKAIKDRKTDKDWLSADEEVVRKYIADQYCGHPNTSGFWHGFLNGMNTLYRKPYLSKIDKKSKILIVAGSDDPVGDMGKGPLSLEKMYKKLGVSDVKCIIYSGMRHEILNEKDHLEVYKNILSFLQE